MKCKGARGDEESVTVTAAAGTTQVGRLVDPRIEVATEVAFVLEMTIAVPAVMVPRTLPVVLLKRIGASEVTTAIITRPVETGTAYMLLQGMVVREPSRASITIRP